MGSTSTRLALPYPVGTDTPDVPRDIKALTDKLDPIMPTDTHGTLGARPAAGVSGRYYTDDATNITYRDTGSAWVVLGVGAEFGYVENTTAVITFSGTTSATAQLLASLPAITFLARPVLLEFFVPYVNPSTTLNAQIIFGLFDGATALGLLGQVLNPAASSFVVPAYLARRITPSAAPHTYNVQAWVALGTGTIGAGDGTGSNRPPIFLRATAAG